MSLSRKLEFRDRFVYHLIRQINGDCEGEPITFPDNTTPIKFVVEMNLNEFTSILSALYTGADLSYPDESHEVVWRFLRQVECPVSICDEILECLQPAFDEINEKLDDINETVDDINEKIDENSAKPPNPVLETNDARICGGAAAVLEYMNTIILATYAESESGFFDNVTEAVAAIISAIPVLGQLPFDELILLANSYFENQQTEYETDYTAGYNEILFDLYCKLLATNGELTYTVWGAWLEGLQNRVPDNRASYIFSRFAPAYQTFLNQIANFIFGENSLENFFSEIYLYYLSGAETPSFVCAGADCGNWRHTLVSADFPEPATFELGYGEFDGLIKQTTPDPSPPAWTGVFVQVDFGANTDITQFIVNLSRGENIEGKAIVNRFMALYDSSMNLIMDEDLPIENGSWNMTIDGAWTDVRYAIVQYIFSGADTVTEFDEITFAGTGTNPFG